MFDQELERLSAITQSRTIGSRGKVTLREILSADIPPCIQHFFRRGVEEKFAREWKQTESQSKFSYAHPTVQTIKNELQSVLVLNYSFPRKEFLHSLDDGIHLMLNYLLRPQWTLISFIFNSREKISSTTMREMLKGFSEYAYIDTIVGKVIEKTKMTQFTLTEFELLLHNLDKEYVLRKMPNEIAEMMKPIFTYFTCGSSLSEKGIPVQAALKFFEDKKMDYVVECIQKSKEELPMVTYSKVDIQKILENTLATNGGYFLKPSSIVAEVATTFQKKEEVQMQVNEISEFEETFSSTAPTEEEVLALLKRPSSHSYFPLEEINNSDEKEFVPIEPSDDFSPRKNEEHQHHGPLFAASSEGEQKKENVVKAAKDIRSTISERMQKKFTKKIFRRNETEYQQAIDNINAMQSWNEARLYIGDIFIYNDIDPYSSAAAKFTDVVHSWFRK
jgi:hypothetical protein